MRVITAVPPMYRDINAAFDVRGKPVIFCFGDTIYNPNRIKVGQELMVHESVHSKRQGDDPHAWWQDYIANPEFRLAEEMPAHIAEFVHMQKYLGGRPLQRALHRIAHRLSSPLYGSMIDYEEARHRISSGSSTYCIEAL